MCRKYRKIDDDDDKIVEPMETGTILAIVIPIVIAVIGLIILAIVVYFMVIKKKAGPSDLILGPPTKFQHTTSPGFEKRISPEYLTGQKPRVFWK